MEKQQLNTARQPSLMPIQPELSQFRSESQSCSMQDVYLPQIRAEVNEEIKEVTKLSSTQPLDSKRFESSEADIKIDLTNNRKTHSRISDKKSTNVAGEAKSSVSQGNVPFLNQTITHNLPMATTHNLSTFMQN